MMKIVIFVMLLILCLAASTMGDMGANDDPYVDGDMPDDYNSYMDMMHGMGMGGMGMPGMTDGGGGEDEDATPPFETYDSMDEVTELAEDLNVEQAAVIAFFERSEHPEDILAFGQVADEHSKDFRWGLVMSRAGLEDAPCQACIMLYRPAKYVSAKYGERTRYRYPGKEVNTRALKAFLWKTAPNLVGHAVQETGVLYDNAQVPLVMVFGDYDAENDASTLKYLRNRVFKTAAKHQGDLLFAVTSSRFMPEGWAEDFDLTEEMNKKPKDRISGSAVVGMGIVHNRRTWSQSKPIAKFSADAVEHFVTDYLTGELGEGKLIPQEEPEQNDDHGGMELAEPGFGAVTVTKANFDSIVKDPTKDVLLEVYAPWCGHCRALAPEFERVAQHFGDDDGVVIAAMDGDQHTPPADLGVQGYPSILFLPAAKKSSLISYDGQRTANELISFVQSNRLTK